MTSPPSTQAARLAGSNSRAAQTQHDERHDHNGHPAHDLDTYIRELVDAAPSLTSEQRHTLALILRGSVPARPAGATTPDQVP